MKLPLGGAGVVVTKETDVPLRELTVGEEKPGLVAFGKLGPEL